MKLFEEEKDFEIQQRNSKRLSKTRKNDIQRKNWYRTNGIEEKVTVEDMLQAIKNIKEVYEKA